MPDLLNPATPAGAYDAFLPDALTRAAAHRPWTPADGPLPAIYLSHGAPPLFDDGPWLRELSDWALSLPKPKAIVIVSAHWEDAPLMLSAPAAGTPLYYDFGGFHRRYYQMRYATPDATSLAARLAAMMPDTEPLHQHPTRGLDHGAWIPLMAMYPLADIPVVQMSMPTPPPRTTSPFSSPSAPPRTPNSPPTPSSTATWSASPNAPSNCTDPHRLCLRLKRRPARGKPARRACAASDCRTSTTASNSADRRVSLALWFVPKGEPYCSSSSSPGASGSPSGRSAPEAGVEAVKP